MSARNLTALGFSVGVGVITGVYIFKPTFQEQHMASEFWRNPGEGKTADGGHGVQLDQQHLGKRPLDRPDQGHRENK